MIIPRRPGGGEADDGEGASNRYPLLVGVGDGAVILGLDTEGFRRAGESADEDHHPGIGPARLMFASLRGAAWKVAAG